MSSTRVAFLVSSLHVANLPQAWQRSLLAPVQLLLLLALPTPAPPAATLLLWCALIMSQHSALSLAVRLSRSLRQLALLIASERRQSLQLKMRVRPHQPAFLGLAALFALPSSARFWVFVPPRLYS
eukprot:Mycagemm_TRINITY_DN10302_c2_g5::TRINITY_DN10302_c2_g5_i2::g.1378::m.1378 type:complete len:126 gc:universal TRINITY_DN10302_c2_g5_i2:961-1338(+)